MSCHVMFRECIYLQTYSANTFTFMYITTVENYHPCRWTSHPTIHDDLAFLVPLDPSKSQAPKQPDANAWACFNPATIIQKGRCIIQALEYLTGQSEIWNFSICFFVIVFYIADQLKHAGCREVPCNRVTMPVLVRLPHVRFQLRDPLFFFPVKHLRAVISNCLCDERSTCQERDQPWFQMLGPMLAKNQ
jgi:hypothetical protein